MTMTDEQSTAIREIAVAYAQRPGALLPLLHAVQDHVGHIPATAVPVIAEVLNLSRAEVHGVISFYHLFRTEPPGARTLYLCRAEACQSMGARELVDYDDQGDITLSVVAKQAVAQLAQQRAATS